MIDRSRIPIGIDEFGHLRRHGLFYIDKTRFIEQLIENEGVQVFLFPRPRRFGKTMAMTMLKAYFEKSPEDRSAWFEGLHIWQAGPKYREHYQKYPLIYLTLKDVKEPTAEAFFQKLKLRMADLYEEHRAVLQADVMSQEERKRYQSILDGSANMAMYEDALFRLCAYLHRAHKERVMLLMDEYDAPIHEAYLKGFSDPILDFFRRFLGSALKSNPHLHKAVLTGILRISKESIFSDLNNVQVCSILRKGYWDAMGFTESEVSGALEEAGMSDKLPEVRKWYNGYLFGDQVMYNPWSVLNYIASGGEALSYWGEYQREHIDQRGAHPLCRAGWR
jgi:Predicted AAA-ATPase